MNCPIKNNATYSLVEHGSKGTLYLITKYLTLSNLEAYLKMLLEYFYKNVTSQINKWNIAKTKIDVIDGKVVIKDPDLKTSNSLKINAQFLKVSNIKGK